MKVSTNKKSPYYDPEIHKYEWLITLDGVDVTDRCELADDESGVVLLWDQRWDEAGHLVLDTSRPPHKEEGFVVIHFWREGARPIAPR